MGLAVGGQDLLCVKQRSSSPIPSAELKGYLEELGDCLFSDANSPILERKAKDNPKKVGTCLCMCTLVHVPVCIHLLILVRQYYDN